MDYKVNIKNDKYYFISPLDARHYILDIPVTKRKYQYNAVKFALKSFYPGTEETTAIDYFCSKNKVIGIASSMYTIEKLKQSDKKIISPVILATQSQGKNIAVSVGNDWVLLQVVNDGDILFLNTFLTEEKERFSRILKDLFYKEEYKEFKKELILYAEKNELCEELIKLYNFESIKKEKIFVTTKIHKAQIFSEKRKDNNLWKVVTLICFFIFLIFTSLFFYKKSLKTKEKLEEIKLLYQVEKDKLIQKKQDKEIIVREEKKSVSFILTELYEISSTMKINNLNISGKTIKFEAEDKSAIKIFDKLTNTVFFQNVVLHQSVLQEDGTEKFIISLKVVE